MATLTSFVEQKAQLLFMEGGEISSIQALISSWEREALWLHCQPSPNLRLGRRCLLTLDTERGLLRARGQVSLLEKRRLKVQLREPLQGPERRLYQRISLPLYLACTRLEEARRLTLTQELKWSAVWAELSPSGFKGLLPGRWAEKDHLLLHLRPLESTKILSLRAKVLRLLKQDEAPPIQILHFLSPDEEQLKRLLQIVDGVQLGAVSERS